MNRVKWVEAIEILSSFEELQGPGLQDYKSIPMECNIDCMKIATIRLPNLLFAGSILL